MMNTYKVSIESAKRSFYGGGMALVVAQDGQTAIHTYIANGKYGEEFYFDGVHLMAEEIDNLLCQEEDAKVLCESFYIE